MSFANREPVERTVGDGQIVSSDSGGFNYKRPRCHVCAFARAQEGSELACVLPVVSDPTQPRRPTDIPSNRATFSRRAVSRFPPLGARKGGWRAYGNARHVCAGPGGSRACRIGKPTAAAERDKLAGETEGYDHKSIVVYGEEFREPGALGCGRVDWLSAELDGDPTVMP